jgi:hypothetical protein
MGILVECGTGSDRKADYRKANKKKKTGRERSGSLPKKKNAAVWPVIDIFDFHQLNPTPSM